MPLLSFRNYLDFSPHCVLEAGVGSYACCRSRPFWATASCLLFEPCPALFAVTAREAQVFPLVTVSPCALSDDDKGVTFYDIGNGLSFVEGAKSPSRYTREGRVLAKRRVPSVCLADVDAGDIDVALLDMERDEWVALKNMVSRPRLIAVEMVSWRNPEYRHRHDAEIRSWMFENGYNEVGFDGCDVFWRRED